MEGIIAPGWQTNLKRCLITSMLLFVSFSSQTEGKHVRMKFTAALWVLLLLACYEPIRANTGIKIVNLNRGYRGIVPCPLIASHEFMVEDIDAMYWYFGHKHRRSLLISYFQRRVAPQNGIPEGMYNIDHEFSLVIENVTDSDEGNYVWEIKPKMRLVETGYVPVGVKVSPREPFPTVIHDEHPSVPGRGLRKHGSTTDGTSTLTCIVHHAKPAVIVMWLRVLSDGHNEDMHANETVEHTLLPEGSTREDSFWINNTYTTSAMITATPDRNEDTRYRCEVYGEALGDRNGRHVTVILIETHVSGETGAAPWTTEGSFGPLPDGEDVTAASDTSDHQPDTIVYGMLIGISVSFVSSFLL